MFLRLFGKNYDDKFDPSPLKRSFKSKPDSTKEENNSLFDKDGKLVKNRPIEDGLGPAPPMPTRTEYEQSNNHDSEYVQSKFLEHHIGIQEGIQKKQELVKKESPVKKSNPSLNKIPSDKQTPKGNSSAISQANPPQKQESSSGNKGTSGPIKKPSGTNPPQGSSSSQPKSKSQPQLQKTPQQVKAQEWSA